jgi:nodulation protein E
MRAWEALRIVSPDACRPFSRNRTGMVPGEGAAILVLEERESAMRRGARIYAEIAGFGMSADAADMLAPTVDGAARAMSRALADARMDAGAVRYINAHGTATMMNDRTECRAIRMAFGSAAEDLEISSSKAVIGHAIGAAGALEAVVTLLAMDRKVTPPTANHVEPDPECGLDVVPNVARDSTIGAALSNSFGFGGLNASVAFASP